MRYTFYLLYALPEDVLAIRPALEELGNAGLRQVAQDDEVMSLWFSREGLHQLDAVSGAMEDVTKVLPQVKFIKVLE